MIRQQVLAGHQGSLHRRDENDSDVDLAERPAHADSLLDTDPVQRGVEILRVKPDELCYIVRSGLLKIYQEAIENVVVLGVRVPHEQKFIRIVQLGKSMIHSQFHLFLNLRFSQFRWVVDTVFDPRPIFLHKIRKES